MEQIIFIVPGYQKYNSLTADSIIYSDNASSISCDKVFTVWLRGIPVYFSMVIVLDASLLAIVKSIYSYSNGVTSMGLEVLLEATLITKIYRETFITPPLTGICP